MKKIRIVDLDSKMGSIPLMKIGTFYDDVEWHNPLIDNDIDILYISKIFTFTEDYKYLEGARSVIKGGTGYNLEPLPPEIDKIRKLNYNLYPNIDFSLQYFSRGCIRNCPFCLVRQKEGFIKPVEPLELNPRGKHIEVLDNNFFANPEWKGAAEQLLKWGQPVNFHGIDVRILTEEQAYYLNKIKRHKRLHIAWDNPKEDLVPKLKEVIKWIKPYKIMCYVLIGYWSTPEEDLYRVEKLRELGINPFVMAYDKTDPYQKNFARWVNRKPIFATVKWEDYKKRY